jgi:hypothetical protein
VVIPAHEGFPGGNASYYWSSHGWANDWVHGLDMETSSISWPLDIIHSGPYQCFVNYASRAGNSGISFHLGGNHIEKELPSFVPVPDQNYSRIDRSAEAIGQTWRRENLGKLELKSGLESLVIRAADPELELLSIVLVRK